MGKVMVALTMSLDGFIAGPNDTSEQPLGDGGAPLFDWMTAGSQAAGGVVADDVADDEVAVVDRNVAPTLVPPEASKPVIDRWVEETGAIVSGRRTFDIAGGWEHGHPIDVPIFVVTHAAPTEGAWSPQVTFVTEGLERAVELAREAAGDRAVSVAAASPVQQLLRAGMVDEIEVSVVPYLLGRGVRLLDSFGPDPIRLEQVEVVVSAGVTHLRYNVIRP